MSAAAWRLRALSASGAVAATAVGTATFLAGAEWAALLIWFFVSSTIVSRLRDPLRSVSGAATREGAARGIVARGARRDAIQVLANGTIVALAALGSVVVGGTAWPALGAGALAAATADTWSTEIGTRWGGTPRHILRWVPLPRGTSGGVTLVGSVAALAGALLTSAVARAVQFDVAAAAIFAGGVVGALTDSVLGATAQERRWCDRCGAATERRIHTCGAETRVSGGLRRFDNDAVNFTSIGIGALVTCLFS